MLEANQWGDLERISEEFNPITLKTEENTYWKDYEYGWPIQKLRPWIEVEWSTWWWNIKTWYSSIPSGYTNFSITWVWFKPKAIQVTVYNWSNKIAWGNADNISWSISQRCIYFDWTNYSDQNTRLFRFDWTNRWDLVSFDTDWFTIKSDLSAIMIWTCFW